MAGFLIKLVLIKLILTEDVDIPFYFSSQGMVCFWRVGICIHSTGRTMKTSFSVLPGEASSHSWYHMAGNFEPEAGVFQVKLEEIFLPFKSLLGYTFKI